MRHIRHRLARTATLCAVTSALAAAPAMAAAPPSGGAGFAAIAPSSTVGSIPAPPSRHGHGKWFGSVTVTEYWPAPERWFVGRAVSAPGLPGRHRVDWLYSATGVSMEGEGIGLDGRLVHIDALGTG